MTTSRSLRRWTIIIAAITVSILFVIGAWQLHKSRSMQLFGELVTAVGTADSVVALTFDDGPTIFTDSVLDLLSAKAVVATFFDRSLARAQSAVARRIVERGHELGNHSYSHRRNEMTSHVLELARPGSIILLHVEVASRVAERAALPAIVDGLRQRGYRFVTVSQLMAARSN